ncbi:MAG: hypothetical protein CVV24_08745 [Ignavibacteriae bacterium HGW-Ignavibacteriae-3]|nr:MAG: hypothetical protein CVV24_08745 [Ignavibacteriae bacterium HGW-Ignavibacteriae-3]
MRKTAILLLLAFSSTIFAQLSAPRITAKSMNHDFGTIVEGQVVSHKYEIENKGTAELKISMVRATCGCTAAKPDKMNLKPGEKTFIQVEFNSENRLGPQDKYIYVSSNDPVNPEFKLTFTGVIVDKNAASKEGKSPKLKLSKSSHDFGNVEEGKVVDVKVGFKNEGKSVLVISDVKTSCGCAAALLSSKSLQPGESGSLRIELDTANYEGKLTRSVTLYSNDSQQPNQTIILFVNILKRKS